MNNAEWLEYLISSNPQGVMDVLHRNGYTGYLAPQDQDELFEASQYFIESKGDYAIIELIKSHPLYDIIVNISNQKKPGNFKNADGTESSIITTLQKVDYKKLIEGVLVLVGIFYVADKLCSFLLKKE